MAVPAVGAADTTAFQPRNASAHDLNVQITLFEVGAVEISYFKFTTMGWDDLLRKLNNIIVIKV